MGAAAHRGRTRSCRARRSRGRAHTCLWSHHVCAHTCPWSYHECAHTISMLTPCPCSPSDRAHGVHTHTTSVLTPRPCSHHAHAHPLTMLTPQQPVLPAPQPSLCFPHSVPGSPARHRGRSPSGGNKLCRGLTSPTLAHPRTLHPPARPCPPVTPPRCVSIVRATGEPARQGWEHPAEPGKNRPGIKLAGAFIAGILFLNAMENTSLEGKSKRPGPACGIKAYPCPHGECPPRPRAGCSGGAGCGVPWVRQQGR